MLVLILLITIHVSTIYLIQSVNAQTITESSDGGAGAGTDTDNNKTFGGFNRTGFTHVSNVMINNKTYPIKYNITGGKLLGIVADNDRTNLVIIMAPDGSGGKLVIEIPRNVLDAKAIENDDTKFEIKIDDNGVDYKEIGNSDKARILEINFNKDNRIIEITGSKIAS
jgi:hypothetical protein